MWGLESVMAELMTGARVAGSAARKLDLECLAHLSEAGREVLAGVLICPKKRLTAVEEALEQMWSSFKEPFGS